MSKFIEVLNKIYEKNKNYDEMEQVELIIDELMENLKNSHNYMYDKTLEKLEGIAYTITKEEAEEIVKEMKPYSEKWNYETIKEYLSTKGIDNHIIDYYLTMNMAYNDYYELAKSVDKEEDADFILN